MDPQPPRSTSLPSITTLRRELDYGDSTLDRCAAFNDDVRVFRKRYSTTSGVPGVSLYEWKAREHQVGLSSMTVAFLDRDGFGPIYWPDDESSMYFNKLQYSKDHRRIRTLVRLLFFRLNQQQHRNHKYKSKMKAKSALEALRKNGQRTEDPIDVDASPSPDMVSLTDYSGEFRAASTCSSVIDPVLREFPAADATVVPSSDSTSSPDIPAPDQVTPPASPRQDPSVTTKDGVNPLDIVPSTRVITRSASSRVTSGRINSRGLGDTRRTQRTTPRRTGRQRKQVDRSDRATEEEVRAFAGSPTPGLELASAGVQSSRPKLICTVRFDKRNLAAVADAADHTSTDGISASSPVRRNLNATVEDADEDGDDTAFQSQPPMEVGKEDTASAFSTVDETTLKKAEDSRLTSTIPPTPSSLADDKREYHVAGKHHESALVHHLPAKPASPEPDRPNIKFMYSIVLSRTPKYREQPWEPQGKFQEKTLQTLFDDLQLQGDVIGLGFQLEGPNVAGTLEVQRGDETRFQAIKKRFNRLVMTSLASGPRSDSPLLIELWIEPLREGDGGLATSLADEAVLSW